ncbi:unnamed protein product [Kluyveromyces dobzhanskii CBS 2104]|uniref:WGS project CCBQ000000000 data, contig 00046 n=1 Tax=Kluyveromyces dobzhanskii CBS 2104 TaxID=1427455 RepID=A0A0A8L719_9SACH|nr:unnamed protein product [Kluyveromyces dobzhanskii CBS 2104]
MSMDNSQSSLLNLASLVQEESDNGNSGKMQNNTQHTVSNTGSNFSITPRAMQGLSLPQLEYSSAKNDGDSAQKAAIGNGNGNSNGNGNGGHFSGNSDSSSVSGNSGSSSGASATATSSGSTTNLNGKGNGRSTQMHNHNGNRNTNAAVVNDKNNSDDEGGIGAGLDGEDYGNGDINDAVNDAVNERIRDSVNTTGRSTPGFMQYPKSTMSTSSLQRMNVQVPSIDIPLVGEGNSPHLSSMNINGMNMALGNHHSLGKMGASPSVNSMLGNSNSVTPVAGGIPVGVAADRGGVGPMSNSNATAMSGASSSSLLGMQMPMMLNSGSDLNSNTNVNANNSNNSDNGSNGNGNSNGNDNSHNNSHNNSHGHSHSNSANTNNNSSINKLTNNTNNGVMYAGVPGGVSSSIDNNASNAASQRMMNMKSDLADLPMNPPNGTANNSVGMNSVPLHAPGSNNNASSLQPGQNPVSLLQNSTTLATSSLPTITMINDGERLTHEGELIGKSGKALRNTKRAAQNRNAQRAFRQRREKHIKELEFKARDYNRIAAELETSKAENRMLKYQLGQYQQKINL